MTVFKCTSDEAVLTLAPISVLKPPVVSSVFATPVSSPIIVFSSPVVIS